MDRSLLSELAILEEHMAYVRVEPNLKDKKPDGSGFYTYTVYFPGYPKYMIFTSDESNLLDFQRSMFAQVEHFYKRRNEKRPWPT